MSDIEGEKLIAMILRRFETHIIVNQQMSEFLASKGLTEEFNIYLELRFGGRETLQ